MRELPSEDSSALFEERKPLIRRKNDKARGTGVF